MNKIDKVHESVCTAAGWQVRCDRCGGYTRRGNGVMICRISDCQTAQEKYTAERIIRQEGVDGPDNVGEYLSIIEYERLIDKLKTIITWKDREIIRLREALNNYIEVDKIICAASRENDLLTEEKK